MNNEINYLKIGTSPNLSELSYRRTYLYLNDVLTFIRSQSKSNHLDDPLFLTTFAAYFLLNEPQFNFDAHNSSSIQTFYANHYLRDVLKVDALPEPKNVLLYAMSDKFTNDIKHICLLFSDNSSDTNRITELNSNIASNSTSLATAGFLFELIRTVVFKMDSGSGSAYISPKINPPEKIYNEISELGFSVEHDFLSPATLSDIAHITTEIAKYEKKRGTAYFYGEAGNNQRIYNLLAKHPIFADLISSPYITTLCDRIFDRPTLHEKFGLNSLTAHIVPPGAKAIPMHIDSVCPDPIPPWMIRFIIIVPLESFTKHNGATTFIPSSHKYLRRPTPDDIDKTKSSEIVIECNPGSLVLFDGATWHRSSANRTSNARPGLMLSFAASYFMELCGEEEHLTVIPNETIQNFSPKVQQMIGYKRAIKKGATDISKKISKINYNFSKL